MLRLAIAVVISLIASGFAAAQQVTVERDSTLHAEPRHDAAVVSKISKGAKAEAVGKQGAWVNLKAPAASGWILSFNVRFAAAEGSAASSGSGGGAARLFSGQKPQITATIGMRGLDGEDLKRAAFNSQQMSLLDRYAATKDDGEQAAQASGLTAVKLDYLVK